MTYYVNKNAQSTGEHEVHRNDCHRLPDVENRLFLGYFTNGIDAVKAAKLYYSKVDGCYYCCKEAHTG